MGERWVSRGEGNDGVSSRELDKKRVLEFESLLFTAGCIDDLRVVIDRRHMNSLLMTMGVWDYS